MSDIILPAPTPERPEILAPAGDAQCFTAALAAGADAVYLGLKHFSARMQAENFGLTDLSRLTDLAHEEQARVYVAMNVLVKPQETAAAYRLIHRLARQVRPDGIIVQDLAMLDLARQAGFEGEINLSTLANITHPQGLQTAKDLGASRVILPRELSIDEIRAMGEACPEGLDLECFVHGALCYCVSGRCYWSSYMGGKSGLRGRCVQPCRRVYRQGGAAAAAMAKQAEQQAREQGRNGRDGGRDMRRPRPQRSNPGKGRDGRFFSCLDLSLDVLAKTLLHIPHLVSWKIEGRKKGPHYVYHVVTAYRMLRDNPGDPQARKDAEAILEMALGRPGSRARFLPHKDNLIPTDPSGQTSSGLLAGKINVTPEGQVLLKPHFELLPQDYLRVFRNLYQYVDYFTVNVSYNTTFKQYVPRTRESVCKILEPLFDFRRGQNQYRPILLKISPDLSNEDIDTMTDIMMDTPLDGIVATNAMVKPSDMNTDGETLKKAGYGAISGDPLTRRAIEVVSRIYERCHGTYPIIGVGGLMSPTDVKAMLNAGATLVQTYTGYVYNGPRFVGDICRSLIEEENNKKSESQSDMTI